MVRLKPARGKGNWRGAIGCRCGEAGREDRRAPPRPLGFGRSIPWEGEFQLAVDGGRLQLRLRNECPRLWLRERLLQRLPDFGCSPRQEGVADGAAFLVYHLDRLTETGYGVGEDAGIVTGTGDGYVEGVEGGPAEPLRLADGLKLRAVVALL